MINMMIQDAQFHFVLFSIFLPIKAEHDFVSSKITYWGYSEKFDEVEEGHVIPQYDFVFEDKNGAIAFKEVKRL